MSIRNYFYLSMLTSLAVLMSITSCSKRSTDATNNHKLSVNITLPYDTNQDGHAVMMNLFSDWQAETPIKTARGTISDNGAIVNVTNIATGTYFIMVAVDSANDGFVEPLESGDLFWATLNVEINQDKTINLTQYYWQTFKSMVFALENLPEEQNGKVCAAGIFEQGTNIFAPHLEPIAGGNTIIYNNCAILAINHSEHGDSIINDWQLPNGNYEIWGMIDVDGEPADWNNNNDSSLSQITDGDLIDSVSDWTYTQGVTDNWQRLTPSFTPVEAISLTLNMTFSGEYSLTGHQAYIVAFANWGDEDPVVLDSTTISGSVATKILGVIAAGTYQLILVADVDDNGIENGNDVLSQGDLIWGTLDLAISENRTIEVSADCWQPFHSFVFGIKGIPAGHNGQPMAVALMRHDATIARGLEDKIMSGAVPIYNNSALIALSEPTSYPDSVLSTDDYDVWFLIDADGSMDDYQSDSYWPISVDDQYYKYNYRYTFDPNENDNFNMIDNPTFLPIVGVSGTVTCPSWESGHGPIDVLLFYENPLGRDGVQEVGKTILNMPGDYSIPCFGDTVVFAVGAWDVDNSGFDSTGATANDVLGIYGASFDDMTPIPTGQVGAANIAFELNIVYNPRIIRR